MASVQMDAESEFYDTLHQQKYRDSGQTFDEHAGMMAYKMASDESHRDQLEDLFFYSKFLPAGRVQAAMGASEREVSAFNCSVSRTIEDDMSSIMAAASESAGILRLGTGIGYNFSNIRPRGALIKSLQTEASGPVSFMQIFEAVASTIASSGHRRGAQMAVLNCLSGETRVATLLDGDVPIKDLVGKTPILWCTRDGKAAVEVPSKIFKSGEKRVVTVWLDSGSKITCTHDHEFMLANGAFVKASELKTYDSLMAITRTVHNSYKQVGVTGARLRAEHMVVYESLIGEVKPAHHIHHKDFYCLNNSPNNLEMLTVGEHSRIHGNIDKHRDRIASVRKGKTLEEWLGEERAVEIKANMRKAKQKQADSQDIWNKGMSGESYKEHYANGYKNQYSVQVSPDDVFGFTSTCENHKVLKVEDLGEIQEVYDITMPNTHNFFAEGVCVHNCDHPDIEAFIDCKMVKGAFRQFNISVGITDDFMYALENGGDYALHHNGVIYATVPADRIWTKIMRNAYESAEPGILFIDRINKQNNLSYCETIEATNPCAEQPLPPHGLCLLGSFNLTRYMAADKIDVNALVADVPAIVEAYDNIFDASVYAIPEHEREAQSKRRMGIGLTGIANAIEYTTKSPYGSPKFCNEFERVAKALRNALYRASINLAKERGAFSLFDADYYGKSPFIRSLPEDIQEDIQIHGVRNSHLISYAPCGTISQVAGNISSGVEPVFFHTANRDVHMREGKRSVTLHDHNVKVHGYYGRTLNECSVEDHIAVGKIAQRYCDSSVSKTVNVAASCSYDDYERIYREAYFHGLKGVTVFRPTELRGAVITEAKKEKSFRYGEVQCSNGECSV